MASQYVSFAVAFAVSVLLARWYITPAQLGQFSIAFAAVTLIASLQDFGITRYVTGETDLDSVQLRSAFTVSVVVALGVAGLALLCAKPVAEFYGHPELADLTRVIAASYLFIPLAIIPQALRQRELDFKSNAVIEVGAGLLNALVSVVLAVRGFGAEALAWGVFAQQAGRMGLSQWRNGLTLPYPATLAAAGPIWRFGGGSSLMTINGALAAKAPELVIGHLLGNTAVGLFARASGLAGQLRTLLSGAVAGVFYPAFARVRDSGAPLAPPYLRVVGCYCVLTWPAMAAIAALAEPLIRLLYGERWIATAPVLQWIALSQMCFVALPLHTELPLLSGRMRALIRRNIADTAISLALLALGAWWGLTGVALSRLAYGIAWIALYAGFLRGIVGFSWRDILATWVRSALVTLPALLPALLAYATVTTPATMEWKLLLATSLAGAVLWLAAVVALRHPVLDELLALVPSRMRYNASRATF